ncbi:MAG: hypothetical protein NC485_14770 [Ruminococcus flavefaciens]|nr:hypothetical protein [Ruminococcus flavefaciens]
MNLNKKILDRLFINKDVTLEREKYIELYNRIWFAEESFISFLQTRNPDIKLSYAKVIFRQLLMLEDIILPLSLVKSVIETQYVLVKETTKYVPQDHIVHSVNMYILGVYLFFNHELFQKKLLNEYSVNYTKSEKIFLFLRKWRLFAFYHDVGYYMEAHVNGDGKFSGNRTNLNHYKNVYDDLINEYSWKRLAKTLAQVFIIKYTKTPFEVVINDEDKWFSSNNEIETKELNCIIERFKRYKMFQLNDYGFVRILAIAGNQEILFLIKDSESRLVGLIEMENQEIKSKFCKKIGEFDSIKTLSQIKDLKKMNYEVYYSFNDKSAKDHIGVFGWLVDDEGELNYDLEIKIPFLNTMNDIYELENELYNFIIIANEKNNTVELDADTMKTLLMDFLNREIYFDSTIKTKDIKLKYKEKIKQLQDSMEEDAGKFADSATEIINKQGVFYNINDLEKDFIKTTKKILGHKKHAMSFIKCYKGNQIEMSLLAEEDKHTKRLVDYLKEKAKHLNIDFEKLRTYRPVYSACDHGLVAAGLVSQSFLMIMQILENTLDDNSFDTCWSLLDSEFNIKNEEVQKNYMDAIFAIMLHNIYAGKEEYQIRYKQNIDKDSFSYFAAFCDWLQKWDRPQQVDQAHANLPTFFIAENFDFEIRNNKIFLATDDENRKKLQKQCAAAQSYLEGFENIVKM